MKKTKTKKRVISIFLLTALIFSNTISAGNLKTTTKVYGSEYRVEAYDNCNNHSTTDNTENITDTIVEPSKVEISTSYAYDKTVSVNSSTPFKQTSDVIKSMIKEV